MGWLRLTLSSPLPKKPSLVSLLLSLSLSLSLSLFFLLSFFSELPLYRWHWAYWQECFGAEEVLSSYFWFLCWCVFSLFSSCLHLTCKSLIGDLKNSWQSSSWWEVKSLSTQTNPTDSTRNTEGSEGQKETLLLSSLSPSPCLSFLWCFGRISSSYVFPSLFLFSDREEISFFLSILTVSWWLADFAFVGAIWRSVLSTLPSFFSYHLLLSILLHLVLLCNVSFKVMRRFNDVAALSVRVEREYISEVLFEFSDTKWIVRWWEKRGNLSWRFSERWQLIVVQMGDQMRGREGELIVSDLLTFFSSSSLLLFSSPLLFWKFWFFLLELFLAILL